MTGTCIIGFFSLFFLLGLSQQIADESSSHAFKPYPQPRRLKRVALKSSSRECRSFKPYDIDDYFLEIAPKQKNRMRCSIVFKGDYDDRRQDNEAVLIRLNRPLATGETLNMNDRRMNLTLKSYTPLTECFVLRGGGNIVYTKDSGIVGQLQLLLTEIQCMEPYRCRDIVCRADTCHNYGSLYNCPAVCVDDDNRCNGMQQCPFGEDEPCGYIPTIVPPLLSTTASMETTTTGREPTDELTPQSASTASEFSVESSSQSASASMESSTTMESEPSYGSLPQSTVASVEPTTMGSMTSLFPPNYQHVKIISLNPYSLECTSSYGRNYEFDDYMIESVAVTQDMNCMIRISDNDRDMENMIIRLNKPLGNGETVTIQSGHMTHILNNATQLNQCFLTVSDSIITYKKIVGSQSSLQLLLTEFECSSKRKCDDVSCRIDSCQGYEYLGNCPVACIDKDNSCNGLQQCPYAEDEACGRKRCPWWGIILSLIAAFVLISLIVVGVMTILKSRRQTGQPAMQVPIFVNAPSTKSSVGTTSKKHLDSEGVPIENVYSQLS